MAKRLSTDSFVEKAKEIHGDKINMTIQKLNMLIIILMLL